MEQKLLELINSSPDPEAAVITALAVIDMWLHTYGQGNTEIK